MNIAEIWNQAIEKKQKPIEARSRVFASEIGGSMIDRFLKMKGEEYTNPPNSRSMRKFMAGDIWEWIIKTVLIRCGVPFREQESVKLEYPNLLPVSGRIDFIVGGTIDYTKAKERLATEDIPEFMKTPVEAILKNFEEVYPDGNIPEKILEIKSVGSFVFEDLLSRDNPKTHHMYQACVYHLVKKLPTDIVYVCRDDCRLLQYNIDRIAPELEKEIIKDLELITKHYNEDTEPQKEELIIWDTDVKKFKMNWKVQYSCYLTKLYSYTNEEGKVVPIDQPDTYYDNFSSKVSSWNRVVTRIKEGKPMTKNNEQYLEEIKSWGFDINSLIR